MISKLLKIFVADRVWLLFLIAVTASAQTNQFFDGEPWHVATGNLSVAFAQASPVGAFPKTNFTEPPPSVDSLKHLKELGLTSFEDYITWGAVEREPGKWSWEQHDAMEKALHEAGLSYAAYMWIHFPPAWLRDTQKQDRTLMRCMEHGLEANYLSIFDPRTIEWYNYFYKNLREHFGGKLDYVYACILGPYGEGNYPLRVDAFIDMGHCHDGWWCGDVYAIKAFQMAMARQYKSISRLNRAWGTRFKKFADVQLPEQLADKKFKPSLAAFPTTADKQRWLDFIVWYHQALIDFTEQSVKTVLKYFPAGKVRIKPGGSSGGINPLIYGTYCPGYAKMAAPYGIVLQPADCMGAVFADKWVGTAYQFYGVKESTEPCGGLDDRNFIQRMFSDASSGASQFFTYEFETHTASMQKYIHLFTGKSGETETAVFCPTTLYRLGTSLQPTMGAAPALRDLCEFDVLDELLISDGALTTKRYKTLIIFQGEIIDRPILKKLSRFLHGGGKIIEVGDKEIADVAGKEWNDASRIAHVAALDSKTNEWRNELLPIIKKNKGVDGQIDGLWTCRRGKELFIYNSRDKEMATRVAGQDIRIEPHTIWFNEGTFGK